MGKTHIKVDLKGLQKFQQNLNKLNVAQTQQFTESAVKELAARLLRKVKFRTPVGQYPAGSGKMGGTLRREWTVGEVRKTGGTFEIDIINPMEYAPYVEFGHRTANHQGWVEGRFMMTISESELQADAPGILQRKLDKLVKDTLGK